MRIFISVVLCLIMINIAHASSVKQLEMDEMLVDAELVFEGTVTSSEPRWNESKTLIKTYITFNVTEVISGDYQRNTLELSFVGGAIGTNSVKAEGLRQPQIGERGIYFVSSISRSLVNPLVGWSQGHFLLKKDEFGQDTMMTDEHLNVLDIDKSTQSPRTNATIDISNGVAKGVVVSRKANTRGMSASAFKQELKRRMGTFNK